MSQTKIFLVIHHASFNFFKDDPGWVRTRRERFPTYKKAVKYIKDCIQSESGFKVKEKADEANETFEVEYSFNDARGFVSKFKLHIETMIGDPVKEVVSEEIEAPPKEASKEAPKTKLDTQKKVKKS